MADSTIFNDENMSENIKSRLKKCREDVKIYPLAKIVKPEVVKVGDNSMIEKIVVQHLEKIGVLRGGILDA